MQNENNSLKVYIVQGRVEDGNDRALAGLLVKAYDRDLRSESVLGESLTDRKGAYKITYTPESFLAKEKKIADLFLRVFTSGGTPVFETDFDRIIFNASDHETINISLSTPITPDGNEFDRITGEVTGLLGGGKFSELEENNKNRDISFLSKETGIAAEKLEHLVVAHRMALESTRIEAAFFYALFRKNTLLKTNLGKSLRMRLFIDINTEIIPLLYEAALTDEERLIKDLSAAVKESIVPARVEDQAKTNIEHLKQYRQRAQEYYDGEHLARVVNIVSRFVLENKLGEISRVFHENKNDIGAFFQKISDDSFFKTESEMLDAKTLLTLAELLGFDEAIISQVREAQKIKKPEDVKRLAALDQADWKKVLTESASRINVAGKPLDKKLLSFHASSLAKKMEREFPGVAFAAQLEREKTQVLENQDAIKGFLKQHADFDLQNSSIDLFLRDKKLTGDKNAAMRDELKSVQRVFKLVPHYRKTNALLKRNIHSAQSVAAIGETRFVQEVAPEAGISRTEARKIFKKAETINAAAMLVVGELQDTMSALNVPALRLSGLAAKLKAVSTDFPNLKSLFKLTDTCACEHCRSVYSPAAYLVEILQFLDNRSVVDLTIPPPPPPATRPSVKIAKDVLFERRPDLGDIDLGCENANTPLPYIDLVCELLEEAVSPDAGIAFNGVLSDGPDPLKGTISNALFNILTAANIPVTDQAQIFETETTSGSAATLPHYLRDKEAVCKIIDNGGNNFTVTRLRQTLSSAEELAAAPAYVNENAYIELQNKSYAFRLPFDLNLTEARAYFSRFDIQRQNLMSDFQVAGVPADEEIAAEALGLTDAERLMIVAPDAANQKSFWNTTAANASSEIKVVDTFLTKTGVTYKDLDLLLKLKFIDPADNLFIEHLDLSCDTTQKEIANLDDVSLDRIHRFLRLQKKTGWKFETLDEIISQPVLGNGKLDAGDDDADGVTNGNECLIRAADLKKLSEKTGIKLEELLGFYGEIPHEVLTDDVKKPLYHQIFLNKAKNGFIDEGLLPEKVDGSQPLSNLKTSLSVCLRLSEQDFDKLLPILPNGDLTFANLSVLYAASLLIRKLKLKADDFLVLNELIGIDIQDSPKATLEFVEAVMASRQIPLKPADIKFMLRHEAENLADREIKDDKTKSIIEKLQTEFQKAFTANLSPYDDALTADEQKEKLQNLVSKLRDLTEDDVKIVIGLVDADWEFTWTDQAGAVVVSTNAAEAVVFVGDRFDELFDTTQIGIALNAIDVAIGLATTANANEAGALEAIDLAQLAVLTATPAQLPAAQAQLTAAVAAEVLTLAAANAANADVETKRKALVKSFLDPVTDFFFRDAKKTALLQVLATSFKTNQDLAEIVVDNALLKQPLPGTALIGDLLQTHTLIDKVNTPPVLPVVTAAAFPDQYNAIRLLHKLFPLINSFKLANENVAWHLQNNAPLGWFELDSIPYQSGQNPVAYSTYAGFAEMLSVAKQLTPVPNPADAENPLTFNDAAEMLLPASPITRAEWIDTFSLLTGYVKEDVDAIDAHLFPVFSLNNYRNAETWKAIETCAEHLRKLSSTVTQVKEFIKPVLTAADTDSLRMALKARYDEDVWLDTLKQITDAIRPQKRDALVAYLLATNPEMKDENDLYDYFLVDVEMESCMPSSRIVQAHGTVQLFVQRCLMGLEPKAAADLNNDKNWSQWKWMKNYRVWEANRKVFLYPENWIEAELRDDKSFLFSELENELLQNELNEFTAEDALIRYLEKLDNIAFLEVVATWYQSDIRTMHVFARTKGGDPAIYYYRRFEQERYWTPWEKVELDISGDQLLAFVRNNRLCLAWLIFTEEPDPDPTSTIPDIDNPGSQPVDKPFRKLNIQLAVSEFANKKWQPKKVSKEGVRTPSDFTPHPLPKDRYNLLYFELAQQIWIFKTNYAHASEYHEKTGVFNITGCKGYPERVFEGSQYFPDFLPDFRHAALNTQRYQDMTLFINDDLSVRNGISFFAFLELLAKSPNNFKLTNPLQLTLIDFVSLLFQYLLMLILGRGFKDRSVKIPFGTLLPYFMEDSFHAYVIIPGFYREEKDPETGSPIYLKRTGSNALQLIEDIIALITKYVAEIKANPGQDIDEWIAKIKADEDYLKIVAEIKIYLTLRYGEQFKNMYHPLVCPLRTTLYKHGVPELMKRETQLQVSPFSFKNNYQPSPQVPLPLPVEDIDFNSDGSYSAYNWELFFHIPFLLATRLTKNQKFEEALTWFHYMFNPTGALEGDTPQKYWVTKPFYLTHSNNYINQRIDTLLYKIADPATPETAELEFAISQWREKPFKPHVIARFRPVAYQKALLMKYIDNLTEWGDYLFRQDTMESIVQATQMYILADKLLGPKPRIVPPVIKAPYETYNQIAGKLDAFGNALIDLENILPDLLALPEEGAELPPTPVTLSMLYFCIPQNDKMLEYWDRIAERLFNIRHCRNIEGVERSLALFAPPIDPGMLVRAAASGLDISSVLAGINAPTPFYRFNVLSQKATELVQEIRGLGSSLLQALEKKDVEGISLLRNELEMKVLKAVRDMKQLQIKEAKEQIDILKRTKAVTEERNKYYTNIKKIIPNEQLNLDKLEEAHTLQEAAQGVQLTASLVALIPDINLGASGFGGSPIATFKFGGLNLAQASKAASDVLSFLSIMASNEASRASVLGGYDRRFDDWKLQERLAKKELAQIDKQIVAAEIRRDIAETDLKNHDLQIENAKKTDEFMRSKFTNKELYDWTVGQISSVYFRAYQLAYDFAKKAERCYRFELGNDDTYIGFGYWDSMKKGLQSADYLFHDIKRMETGYLDKNKREYEVTKHVSLALVDPLALVRLRATGVCDFEIPEAAYDMDHPGHYFRRLKSVSVSLPCIAGPHTSVSAKLSLVSNKYRKNTAKAQGAGTPKEEYEEVSGNDERFTYNVGAIQSIAASNAQNDSGMFELNFRDERYLPFEGCGAISTWRLEFPREVRQFDYDTISDVVLHIKYTAREGGGGLRGLAELTLKEKLVEIKQQLNQTGLHVALNMKHDLPNEWHLLKTNATVALTIAKSRLPYFVQSLEDVEIEKVTLITRVKNNPASYSVNIDGNPVNLSRIDEWKLCRGSKIGIDIETPFELAISPAQLGNLEDLMIVVKYSF